MKEDEVGKTLGGKLIRGKCYYLHATSWRGGVRRRHEAVNLRMCSTLLLSTSCRTGIGLRRPPKLNMS
jgi:hypothetical protein